LILVSRSAVTGTKYSPILIVVVFGLAMGYILVASGVSVPGLPEFEIIDHISKSTIIALIASFFIGGQELRKTFGRLHVEHDDLIVHSDEIATVGTSRTQFTYIVRTVFILLGIDTAYRVIVGVDPKQYYPLLAYICLIGSIIIIDYKAVKLDLKHYIRKGFIEIFSIMLVLLISFYCAELIRPVIALPQIFFAMVLACSLGAVFYKWFLGPTVRALLFSGLPVVLAANFIIGGSRVFEVFSISEMSSVLSFGFFGQVLWMFGGISLLMVFAKTTDVRNLAPALAGGLSHAGLTGACTAGDLGKLARIRTPIMINMPFLAHVFVFSILAASAERGDLLLIPSLIVFLVGAVLTGGALRTLRAVELSVTEEHKDIKEVSGLMRFSLGWQLVAMFGSFLLLNVFGMKFSYAAASATSSLSHFGLFTATQAGMFGDELATLLPFIFAMPFLVHPFVFFIFGKAMERGGHMPKAPVFVLTGISILGVVYSIISI